MSTTAIVRGAKIPIAALDGFLRANGLIETAGYPPIYGDGLDNESKLLRAKMAKSSGDSNNRIRLFIPYRMGRKKSAFAYVAYDWIFVYGQRKLRLAEELPDAAPKGFSDLRDEIMGFGAKGGEGQEQQPQDEEDDLTSLFVIINDEQSFCFREPFVQEASHATSPPQPGRSGSS